MRQRVFSAALVIRAIEPLRKLQLNAPENFQPLIEQALRKLQG